MVTAVATDDHSNRVVHFARLPRRVLSPYFPLSAATVYGRTSLAPRSDPPYSSSSSSSSWSSASQPRRLFSFLQSPFTGTFRNRLLRPQANIPIPRSNSKSTLDLLSRYVKNRVKIINNRIARLDDSSDNINTNNNSSTTVVPSTIVSGIANMSTNNETPTTTMTTTIIDSDRLTRRQDGSTGDLDYAHTPAYQSPTLNVIDVEPDNTKIAHNILVVKKTSPEQAKTTKPRPSQSTTDLPTPTPVVIYTEVKHIHYNQNRLLEPLPSPLSPAKAEEEFVSIKNNHRPSAFMSFAKWKLKNKMKTSTTTTTTPMTVSTSVKWHDDRMPDGNQLDSDKNGSSGNQINPSSQSVSSSATLPFITSSSSSATTPATHLPITMSLIDLTSSKGANTHWPMAINQSVLTTGQQDSRPTIIDSTPTVTIASNRVTEFDLPELLETKPTAAIWDEPIAGNLFDSVTTTEMPPTEFTSAELMLTEFEGKEHVTFNSPFSLLTSPSPLTTEAKAIQYNSYYTPQNKDSIIIFKNNHGRPRRPLPPRQGQPAVKFTPRPPYIANFNQPTTQKTKTSITVANVVGHRVKQPDEVHSGSLMVLDPPYVPNGFMQLPVNTTIVHKNLLVPMKEGRPKPSYPIRPTTTFPVYPVVAGVNKWHQSTQWVPPITITTSATPLASLPDRWDDIGSASNTTTAFDDSSVHSMFNSSSTTTLPASLVATSGTSAMITTKRPTKPPSRPIVHHPAITNVSHVNAINAPPMPAYRPSHSIDSSTQRVIQWVNRFRNMFGLIRPATGGASFLSMVRSVFYTIMVMLLPPLAFMTVFS